jgi:hypothetical protein
MSSGTAATTTGREVIGRLGDQRRQFGAGATTISGPAPESYFTTNLKLLWVFPSELSAMSTVIWLPQAPSFAALMNGGPEGLEAPLAAWGDGGLLGGLVAAPTTLTTYNRWPPFSKNARAE